MQISTTTNPTPVDDARLAEIHANPGFGQHFTDHMLTVEWTPDAGWHAARIEPYGPLTLDPATAVLHYAQEIFEGMKAYRHDDGSVWTFRPEQNAARMVRSSQRLAFPELPGRRLRRAGRRARDGRPAVGARQLLRRRREGALPAAVHVRLRDLPRRAPGPARHLHGDRVARRCLLQGRRQAGQPLAVGDFTRAGRGGMGAAKYRRQLRRQPLAAQREAIEQRLRPGRLPRRPGAHATSRSSAG